MAFWLAKKRHSQESSYIQRFDPRFWTVNFPRPAMASVITTGPDSMQVDVELHHEGELVGLIWESEDKLDHPLLAYKTHRDFSNTVLSFRWQSEGVIPLDEINGPTLTIEGRDAEGAPQTWFVRLWNYASGDPTDAQVVLPFSDLEGGFSLPGTPINPNDIDRMFISLVAPEYAGGSAAPLSQRVNGRVTVSQIDCDGRYSMLEIGDVRMPVHGERIATAYDDGYDQTPARLIRGIECLGYRDDLVHYVGMSHFMRLAQQTEGLRVVSNGELSEPARQWHKSYFAEARKHELEVIVSISYELFNAYCPDDWKQRTLDGEPAHTGWVPPSTLLSPANEPAMSWLKSSAIAFIEILEAATQPVRAQIGEPWWWTTNQGEICIYDNAARAQFGGSPVAIPDMRVPLTTEQTDLLEEAGSVLAASTADLTSAIRNASSTTAEVVLLAFTPTILSVDMPELYRANLPTGWAAPAFDRLQLEDYDWLTDGTDALRRSAYSFVDARLQYALEDQDYLSGFVLLAEDAEEYWTRIDAGLDEARMRQISRRYVWAQPQINRDGYSRIPQTLDENMDAFDDVLYPFELGRSTAVSPEFSTTVSITASGHERRNSLWSNARIHFDVGPGIRSENELAELIGFFRARRGAAKGFRLSDPFDFSSNGMTGTPTHADQLLGIGDGHTADFQLVKNYGDKSDPQSRPITRVREETLLISVDGEIVSEWTLNSTGKVSLNMAPAQGSEVRAGFLFDVPVRFAEDRIDVSSANFQAGEIPSIPLVEIREELQ